MRMATAAAIAAPTVKQSYRPISAHSSELNLLFGHPVQDRIDWPEHQLAQVKGFIARDQERLAAGAKPSIRLSLQSWQAHEEDLKQELVRQ